MNKRKAQEKDRKTLSGKVFVVIHLFQGFIHEVKVHTDKKIAQADYEGRIIAAYGELVDEQYGKDEILFEEAQVEP
jgi:hypothetical protein